MQCRCAINIKVVKLYNRLLYNINTGFNTTTIAVVRWKVIGAVVRIICSFRVTDTRRPSLIAGAQFSCQPSWLRRTSYLSPASLLIQQTHMPVECSTFPYLEAAVRTSPSIVPLTPDLYCPDLEMQCADDTQLFFLIPSSQL